MARHRTQNTGLLGPVTQTQAPASVEGVRQHGGPVIPVACHHCHAEPPTWSWQAGRGSCRCCGADFFLRKSVV